MKVFYSFKEAVNFKRSFEFFLSSRGGLFPIFIDDKGVDKWVVFFPGAFSREKPMPRFQRSSYTKELPYNVISLFDPGLLINKNITNSWFSGGSTWYAETVADLLKDFFDELGVLNENVLLFGTSAGGLPSLRVAMSLPKCKVYAGNIQTIANLHPAFRKMQPYLFPEMTEEEILKNYPMRFDARNLDSPCQLYYFQNLSDKHHYKNHYSPYLSWYYSGDRFLDAHFHLYDNPASGHDTIGRDNELSVITSILEGDEVSLDLPFVNVADLDC